MKPFNLEAAMAGAPIQRRHGQPVKFVAHVPEVRLPSRVVTAADELLYSSYEDGHSELGPKFDLFMAPTTKTYWVNVYDIPEVGLGLGRLYSCQPDAEDAAYDEWQWPYIKTISLEITQ